MTRRFWLSFCDPDRPEGERFLGVCIVEVEKYEAMRALDDIDEKFPDHQPDAEWIAAATRKAWKLGCNPGGEVATLDITAHHDLGGVELALNILMDRDELTRRGLV